MESLKRSFEHLKNVIVSSNPNLWYAMMMEALGHFENEFNQHLATISPTIKVEEPVVIEEPIIEEPIVVEEPTVEEPIVEEPIVEEPIIEEPTVVEEPVVKKTVKKTTKQ
jgi:UDP-3-O-[3-hydroxymyristoyl] glucosamine N-acyltransferase